MVLQFIVSLNLDDSFDCVLNQQLNKFHIICLPDVLRKPSLIFLCQSFCFTIYVFLAILTVVEKLLLYSFIVESV